uniref:EF-hand domain-containing protein 1 isoform X2 n=1 Tax=Myxine glutinosa TaxID=7769 RepID=UPI00358FF7B4
MEGPRLDLILPFLPGHSFRNRCKSNFHRPQTLTYRNGFRFPQESSKIIFGPRQAEEAEQLTKMVAELTYKQRVPAETTCILPKYVIFDKKDFLQSEGVLLNTPEEMPEDPFMASHGKYLQRETGPSPPKKFQQFLAFDRKVLRFYCLWEEPHKKAGPPRPCVVHYFLADNTLEVRAEPQVNEGRDPFYVLIRRQRLPKILKETGDALFPSCVLELTDQEVAEWLSPSDLLPGRKLLILGCTLHVCDCDEFTKKFYRIHLGITDLATIHHSEPPSAPMTKVLPPYNGFGSLEDSLQNCLFIVPQQPKKDYMKMLDNHNKVLRYSAVLDSAIAEDKGRAFIISYHLSNDTISVFEPMQPNTGHNGGRFLECTRVIKPGSSPDAPVYYNPGDLAIGATIEVFKHHFIITDADAFVLRYMESQKSLFPKTFLSLQQKFNDNKASDEEAPSDDKRLVCSMPMDHQTSEANTALVEKN